MWFAKIILYFTALSNIAPVAALGDQIFLFSVRTLNERDVTIFLHSLDQARPHGRFGSRPSRPPIIRSTMRLGSVRASQSSKGCGEIA